MGSNSGKIYLGVPSARKLDYFCGTFYCQLSNGFGYNVAQET